MINIVYVIESDIWGYIHELFVPMKLEQASEGF